MNAGSIHNPKTAASRVFGRLCRDMGKWVSTWDIAIDCATACPSTRISEVRHQLPKELVLEHTAKWSGELRRQEHYYRIRDVTAEDAA